MVAAVGIGGAIGPFDTMPRLIDEDERNFFQKWMLDLTRGGVIVIGGRTLTLMEQDGFAGLTPEHQIILWTRQTAQHNGGPVEPGDFLEALKELGKPIFICGGKTTFQTFMPYVKQFFVRRVEMCGPHENFMPPLFGRTQ